MTKHQHFTGLTEAEVLQSREAHGVNVLTPPERESLWSKFMEKFQDPLIRILLVAGVLSIGIACYEYWGLHSAHGAAVFFEPIGIFIAILLATGLAFYFEMMADREFAILNQVNDDEPVKVIRGGNTIEIPKRDVVVGDLVILSTGDEVPADGELLEAVSLHLDESTLTGEPVCAKTTLEANFDPEATFPSNHVMRGTKVMEGHGVCRVFAVGDRTENGKVFEAAQIDDSVKTPLNEQLDGLSRVITSLSYLFAGLVIIGRLLVYFEWNAWAYTLLLPIALFFYLVVKKFPEYSKQKCIGIIVAFFVIFMAMVLGAFEMVYPGAEVTELLTYTMQTLMIAVTLIVVAVPEGLPMAVTLSLAYSMRRMLKTNNLVRKMHACETMGAATVICTDKTGTLTQNQMRVYETQFYALKDQQLGADAMSLMIKEGIAVNSTASLDLSDPARAKVLGNPTEGALLLWLKDQGEDYQALKEATTLVEELPFSTERKYMATVVRSANGRRVLYVKGAPEIVYALCKTTAEGVKKEEIDAQLLAYQKQAMRTLGFACQVLDEGDKTIEDHRVVAEGLTFVGVVAIADPVRADVPAAVAECMRAGIAVKIVTGDTPGTAMEIGRQIGLWSDADNERAIITGPEFAALTDEELDERVMDLKIIARARPMDKKRLVESLQRLNQVVSVTGDGTNDAPALNAAHVGLSMGDGTSVAKEASDITIIDNSFSSIGRAVMWGRSLYQNIQRFLLFQLTVNVAACFIVLFGAFMGTESPLTVTQMLWVNLIMDTFGAMALASLPPSPAVMADAPRDRSAFILNRSMISNIVGVGLFFFALTLGFLYIFQHYDVRCMMDLFHLAPSADNHVTPYEQTLLFSIFVWTHFWYMFNTRSYAAGNSYFRLKQSSGFRTIVGVIVVGQIIIVELLYNFFNVEPMFHTAYWQINPTGITDWLIIVGVSSLVLWIRELWFMVKRK
ncbi:MAG: cation-translocating P-type ATPase [Bacteroidaceae bacterium]|nr:cation-translocating P-type ATPase [Bacteroidaceae bacterium]